MPVLISKFEGPGWERPNLPGLDPSTLNADKTEWSRPASTHGSDGLYAVRFNLPKTAGHRIIASADILTDNVDVARVYFRVFDKNGNRLDTSSSNQQSKARITGQYHRVSCSIDCLHPDIGKVQACFGSLYDEAHIGNVKVRNPTIQVDPIPGQKSTPTMSDRFFVGDNNNGGYIDFSTGYARIWKLQDIDLSASSTQITEPALSGIRDANSAGFCVVDEGGLLPDAKHISSMFVRHRQSPSQTWSVMNSNPKPTSRLVPMRFWAEGFIDL